MYYKIISRQNYSVNDGLYPTIPKHRRHNSREHRRLNQSLMMPENSLDLSSNNNLCIQGQTNLTMAYSTPFKSILTRAINLDGKEMLK